MDADPDTGPWERAGLYDPDDPNAAERKALLEYLTERGATIEQMVAAHEAGSLPGLAGDLVTQGSTTMVPGRASSPSAVASRCPASSGPSWRRAFP